MQKLLIVLLLLTACQKKPPTTHFSGIAMTIPYNITVGAPLSKERKKEVERVIHRVFEETHAISNNWNPQSEISRFSKLPPHTKTTLSSSLKNLLELAQKVHTLSEGRFDPTVAFLAQSWKEGCFSQVADYEDVGINYLHFDGEECWKEKALSFDLGGIAKGDGVDKLTEALQQSGFDSLFVEWGGEVRTVGLHPEGRKWQIAIKGVGTLEVSSAAIATSGNYEQAQEVDGIPTTHIIDPRTKRPLAIKPGAIASATVVAPTCALADAIATSLMLFETPEEALTWAKTVPGIECYLAN